MNIYLNNFTTSCVLCQENNNDNQQNVFKLRKFSRIILNVLNFAK